MKVIPEIRETLTFRYGLHHWVDTSVNELLVPYDIIRLEVNTSAL